MSIPVPRVTVDMVSQWCPTTRDTGCVCSLAASGREAVIMTAPHVLVGKRSVAVRRLTPAAVQDM